MAEDIYIQHIKGYAEESAASTFTADEILTGATPGGMLKAEAIGLEVREIITQLDGIKLPDLPATGTIENVAFHLSVQPDRTAIENIADISNIYLRKAGLMAGVGTYLPIQWIESAFPPSWRFTDPLLIPHPKIYTGILSSNSAAAAKMYFRIGFTYVALTGPQVMEFN